MRYHRLAFNRSLTRSFLTSRRRRTRFVGASVIVYLIIAAPFMLYVGLVFSMFVLGMVAEISYNVYRIVRRMAR